MPEGSKLAVELIEPCTTTGGAPVSIVPLVFNTLSQGTVGQALQIIEGEVTVWREKLRVPGSNGPPVLPLANQSVRGTIHKSSGTSKASCTPTVCRLLGALALKPIPRLANPAQISRKFAPPVSTKSA